MAAFAGADEKIIAAIAIQIAPCEARPELTEPAWQQELRREIVELVVPMHMPQSGRNVLEHRWRCARAINQERPHPQRDSIKGKARFPFPAKHHSGEEAGSAIS